MKTIHHLESYDELLNASSSVRQEGDTRPLLRGKLQITGFSGAHPEVHLIDDPSYAFQMPLHDFLNEQMRRLPLPDLLGTDRLTVLNE